MSLAVLFASSALGCRVEGTSPPKADWTSLEVTAVDPVGAVRLDLRDGAEAERWRLRSDVTRAETGSDGLALVASGVDPHVSRPTPDGLASLDTIVIETATSTVGDFVVYPRMAGVEREDWSTPTRAVDPERTKHIADVGALAWRHGDVEEIRIDLPAEDPRVDLVGVELRTGDRLRPRRLGDETRACILTERVAVVGSLASADRLLVPFALAEAGPTGSGSAHIVVRAHDADGAGVIGQQAVSVAPPRRWHVVELELANAEADANVSIDIVDPGSDEPRLACFGRPIASAAKAVSERGARDARPNVLLVSLDTFRMDALERAPYLTRLAREGRLFENTWSSSSWTLPAHVSLFTSTPVLAHDTPRASARRPFPSTHIPDDLPMLAELLAAHGYRTAATTGGGYLSPDFGFARGFERYRSSDDREGDGFDRHLEFVEDFVAESAPGPFFLFVHTYAVHDYFLNDGFYHEFVDPVADASLMRSGSYLDAITSGRASPDYARRLYDAGVAQADRFVRVLVDTLRRATDDAPMLVIVTSDHGESFGEGDGSWHHGTSVEDDQLRVPLIVWGSFDRAPHDGSTTAASSSIDIAPSLLEFVGAAIPERFLGARDRFAPNPAERRSLAVLAGTPHTTRPAGERRLDRAIVARGLKYLRTDEPSGLTTRQSCRAVDSRVDEARAELAELPLARCAPLREELNTTLARLGRGLTVIRTPARSVRLRIESPAEPAWSAVLAGAGSSEPLASEVGGDVVRSGGAGQDLLVVHMDEAPSRIVDLESGETLTVEHTGPAPSTGPTAANADGERAHRPEAIWRGQGDSGTRAPALAEPLRERLKALGYGSD